ncbi:unnamed protein product [Ectocarpus sp. 12 AP-2014]
MRRERRLPDSCRTFPEALSVFLYSLLPRARACAAAHNRHRVVPRWWCQPQR